MYVNKPSNRSAVQFSFKSDKYDIFGTNAWKVIIYLIIAFVYLGIGFLLYKKCSSDSGGLKTSNDEYLSVN